MSDEEIDEGTLRKIWKDFCGFGGKYFL